MPKALGMINRTGVLFRGGCYMYCHVCGAKGYGGYCYGCGAKLIVAESVNELIPQDWSDEIRYEVLLRIPEVRDLIARHASQGQEHLSGEKFLELCDKAFGPLAGVSLAKIATIAQPLYASLGVKTGKTRKESFTFPAGRALVAAICSLARHGQPLKGVEQGADGCLLKGGLPSDIWSFAGDFVVSVQSEGQGSTVEAATVIKGQLYDWGKSERVLDELFADIKAVAG